MNNHAKKMIAPIVFMSLLVLYYVGFSVFCLFIPIRTGAAASCRRRHLCPDRADQRDKEW